MKSITKSITKLCNERNILIYFFSPKQLSSDRNIVVSKTERVDAALRAASTLLILGGDF
jgi:ribosomal protein L7Ae-like RNA K-turn-binding protein